MLRILEIPEESLFKTLLIGIYLLSIVVFLLLLYIPAPYGKHSRAGWGPRINSTLAFIIMELPAVGVIAICFFTGIQNGKVTIVSAVLFFLWELHYIHRTFIYPFLLKNRKNSWPVILIVFAVIFNLANGYLNGRWLFHFSALYSINWFLDPRFIIGAAIFVTGMIINIQSDSILRSLRKNNNKENVYKIPRGGMFKFISGANYFGEIIEWSGWALASWSPAGLCFAIFTVANLVPRAIAHHRWYKETFPDYPSERKAIIPFLV